MPDKGLVWIFKLKAQKIQPSNLTPLDIAEPMTIFLKIGYSRVSGVPSVSNVSSGVLNF